MDNTNGKILKEKMKDEEGRIASLFRLTKLYFLPKFCRVDVQASNLDIFISGYFCEEF